MPLTLKQKLGLLISLVILLRSIYRQVNRITNEPGRVAIVTGAASGIGKECATRLIANGWKIYACDVDANGLQKANYPTQQAKLVTIDIRDETQCQALFTQVVNDGGRLDALLNIAGIVQPGPIMGFKPEQVKLMFDVNLFRPMRLCELFLPLLLKAKHGGSIINLCSVGAKLAWPWSGNYSSTKAALSMFSDGLRREALANSLPLRVSVIAPGPVQTPMSDLFTDKMKAWADSNPTSPFQPACLREADFQIGIRNKGMSADMVAVPPSQVADAVMDNLDSLDPDAFTTVFCWSFSILYYLGLYLPTRLSDRLMNAM